MPACSTMMPGADLWTTAESGCHGGGREKTSLIGESHGPRKAAIAPDVTGRSRTGNEKKKKRKKGRVETKKGSTRQRVGDEGNKSRQGTERAWPSPRSHRSGVWVLGCEVWCNGLKAEQVREFTRTGCTPFARAPEGFDGVELALLHARGLASTHDGHGLPRVDLVRRDRVPVEVAAALHVVLLACQIRGGRFRGLRFRAASF